MNKLIKIGLGLTLSINVLFGCSNCDMGEDISQISYTQTNNKLYYINQEDNDKAIKELAYKLDKNIINKELKQQGMILTTIVSLHDLKLTDYYSYTISEKLISYLHKAGFKMYEFRNNKNVKMTTTGEYYLTRSMVEKEKKINAELILVGTFIKLKKGISIQLRILKTETNEIVSTANVLIPNNAIEFKRKPRTISITKAE